MGNIRTEYNGVMYHSIKEADYARQLDIRVKGKDIKSWQGQVAFPIVINGEPICKYIADFVVVYPDGRQEIIDVKPFDKRTGKFLLKDIYKIKKKLVEAIYKVKIIEQ